MSSDSQKINGSITTTVDSTTYQTDIEPLLRGGIVSFCVGGRIVDDNRESITMAKVMRGDGSYWYYTMDGVLDPNIPPDEPCDDLTWTNIAW